MNGKINRAYVSGVGIEKIDLQNYYLGGTYRQVGKLACVYS